MRNAEEGLTPPETILQRHALHRLLQIGKISRERQLPAATRLSRLFVLVNHNLEREGLMECSFKAFIPQRTGKKTNFIRPAEPMLTQMRPYRTTRSTGPLRKRRTLHGPSIAAPALSRAREIHRLPTLIFHEAIRWPRMISETVFRKVSCLVRLTRPVLPLESYHAGPPQTFRQNIITPASI